ncbi:MAG: leucine-rich repeat protein, partial [Bacillota bacterium]
MSGKSQIKSNVKKIAIVLVVLLVLGCFSSICYNYATTDTESLKEMQQSAIEKLNNNEGEYDTQSIVLTDTTLEEATALAEETGGSLRTNSDGTFATVTLSDETTILDIFSNDSYLQYIAQMSADYYVETFDDEEESTLEPASPNYVVSDTYYSQQTYIDYINVGDAWGETLGSGITVAVIDTGIDTDHSEFAGKISDLSYNATDDKVVKNSDNWSLIKDELGHGTMVAGIVAASIDGQGTVGIASDVELVVIKAECDASGTFSNASDLVFGIYYAIEVGVDVINMSFGLEVEYESENIFKDALALAVANDIICVAAAGNNSTTALTYPAADENVIGVGALAEDSYELAEYSNYGENVEVVAPGTTATTAKNGGYTIANGTSMASPVVAGAIALYLAENKYSTFDDVTEMLYASCTDLGDLGYDYDYGYGIIDIDALICGEVGTVTFSMLTDEVEDIEMLFIKGKTMQLLPEPERLYAIFDGWFYDIHCAEELAWYEDVFTSDLTLYAEWANEDDGVPYTYVTLDDGTVEIRSYTGHRSYITVPDTIDGKTVTSIGDFAFSGESGFKEVNLPDTLTNIGRYAFEACYNITSMIMPDSVQTIDDYAFFDCTRLANVYFGSSSKLATIDNFAFRNCVALTSFEVPKSATLVSSSAFFGATNLRSITVVTGSNSYISQDGVLLNITKSTLVCYPAGLSTSYTLPSTVNTIQSYAFGYAKFTEIELSNVNIIEEYAFVYASLESLIIPDSVVSIGESAFQSNGNLSELNIGSSLTTIDEYVFKSCSIKELFIPNTVMEIYEGAFYGNGITSLEFESGMVLTEISAYAFYGIAASTITIPASVTKIGIYAFYSCSNLEELLFESGSQLKEIGGSAFSGAKSLAEINLPDGVEKIEPYAFAYSIVEEIYLPSSVTDLYNAFIGCSNLQNIYINSGYYTSVDGVVYTRSYTAVVLYPIGKPNTAYTILSGVTTVGEYAFIGAKNLTSINLPSSLMYIKEYGFSGCSGVSSYDLPESLIYIGSYAFASNSSLGYILIPDNTTEISRYAFSCCYNLKEIAFNETSKLERISYGTFANTGITTLTIPANVSSIAQYAFASCKYLEEVIFAANSKVASLSAYLFNGATSLTTIVFNEGSSLSDITAYAFAGLTSLTTVDFGSAEITTVGNYSFMFCESLTSVLLSDSLEYIGRFAFYGTTSMITISIPANVEYIGQYAFYGNNELYVLFQGDQLPEYLVENWDVGIKGYYLDVKEFFEIEDWIYAELNSGGIAILEYSGTDTSINFDELSFGGDILTIGGYSFQGSTATSIVLPSTLQTISSYAFESSILESVTIPASVTFIGRNAFSKSLIEALTFEEGSSIATIEQYAFSETVLLESVSLPASLTSLGSYVFYQSGITSLTFEEEYSLTEIPTYAFAGTKLTSVDIPDCVSVINHGAFRDCRYLTDVTLGSCENLQIMSNVFYNTALSAIHIPATLEYIGEYSFVGLENLTEFVVDEDNKYYTAVDGVLYNKEETKIIAMPAGKTGTFYLPQSVEVIGFGAFENSSITEIIFDDNSNLLTFGYRAFYGASITSIVVPATVISIDYYAFAMCDKLESVIFAEGSQLTGIYEGAFYGCGSLAEISIPDAVREILDYAFYGCVSLEEMPFGEDSSLVSIAQYAFAYTGISNIIFPQYVTE